MSKENPKDDPRQKSDQGSHRQTDKPWKGNPEKEQRNKDTIDLEKWVLSVFNPRCPKLNLLVS